MVAGATGMSVSVGAFIKKSSLIMSGKFVAHKQNADDDQPP